MSNRDTSASSRTANLKAKTLAAYWAKNPEKPDMGLVKGSSATVYLNRQQGRQLLPEVCCVPIVCPPLGPFISAIYDFFDTSDMNVFQNDLRTLTGDPTLTVPLPPAGYDADRPAIFVTVEAIANATNYSIYVSDPTNDVTGPQSFIGPYAYTDKNSMFVFLYPERNYNNTDLRVIVTASNVCGDSVKGNAIILLD